TGACAEGGGFEPPRAEPGLRLAGAPLTRLGQPSSPTRADPGNADRRRRTHGGSRTPNLPALNRTPLPVGLRGRGGRDRTRTGVLRFAGGPLAISGTRPCVAVRTLGRIRTCGGPLRGRLLYPLSYEGEAYTRNGAGGGS